MAMTDEQKMEWLAKIMGSGKMSVGQFIMDNHGTMTINNNMGDSHEGNSRRVRCVAVSKSLWD